MSKWKEQIPFLDAEILTDREKERKWDHVGFAGERRDCVCLHQFRERNLI